MGDGNAGGLSVCGSGGAGVGSGGSGGGSGGGEVQVPPMPPPNESVEVFSPAAYARARDDADVPQDVIDSGHVRYHSLDELFPRAGLGDAWDTCAALRRDCRRALREDLAAQRERQGARGGAKRAEEIAGHNVR